MPEYGPFSKNQLAEKLVNVPEAEMKNFHKQRMRRYKLQYIPAGFLAVLGVVFWFIDQIWLSVIVGIFGFIFFSYVVYKRQSWLRLYHHLVYLREQRLNTLNEMDTQSKNTNKFEKLGKKNEK